MNDSQYQIDPDKIIHEINENGFSKLPSIKDFVDLENVSLEISESIGNKNFQENNATFKKLLEDLGIFRNLIPKLFEHSVKELGYKGSIENKYLVTRKVNPGDKESFRAHFDSHLYTFVFPLKIPNKIEDKNCGELVYFPNIRRNPRHELINILGKIFYKQYASKASLIRLMEKSEYKIEDFNSYQPLLFRGNTFLHSNFDLNSSYNNYRMTCLLHLFDPFEDFGIGSLIRKIRKR